MMNEREKNWRRQRKKERRNTKAGTERKVAMKNQCLEKRDDEKTRKKVGTKKLKIMKKSSNERKKRKENPKNGKENPKNGKGTESLEAERGHRDITNMMIDWTFPTPPVQLQYYHQFLVPPGLQMPPPTIVPRICNAQGEERMEIPRPSMGTQPPQGLPSMGNPDYISPLKREHGIGQPGRDHSGHRQKMWALEGSEDCTHTIVDPSINDAWFGQRNNMSQMKYFKDPKPFFELIFGEEADVSALRLYGDSLTCLTYSLQDEFLEALNNTNPKSKIEDDSLLRAEIRLEKEKEKALSASNEGIDAKLLALIDASHKQNILEEQRKQKEMAPTLVRILQEQEITPKIKLSKSVEDEKSKKVKSIQRLEPIIRVTKKLKTESKKKPVSVKPEWKDVEADAEKLRSPRQ
uniref:Uncharacterized protein n=1 Tax=Romanomermis culicivorax TaxID=13658 RepID=A0A915I2T6_ROMCU